MVRLLLRAALAIGLAGLATAPGLAQQMSDATGLEHCETSAWLTDRDPAGLNVRAGPGTDHPVIAVLPPPELIDGEEFAAEVSIVDSQDGWFRIDGAETIGYGYAEPEVLFAGDGWVSGRFLGRSIEGPYLRSAPSSDAPVIFNFLDRPGEEKGGPYFVLERLLACRGWWIEIEGTYFGERLRGWTDDTCASQVTTCP